MAGPGVRRGAFTCASDPGGGRHEGLNHGPAPGADAAALQRPPFFSSAAFPRIAPFAVFIAFIVVESVLAQPSPWLAVARGILAAALLALFWNRYVELRAAPSLPASEWLLAIFAGFAVFAVWITFDSGWAVVGGESKGFAPLNADGSIDWMLAGLRLFAFALVVPVMEELFWRSFLLRWIDRRNFLALDPRNASWTAFAISCALFACEHSLWFAGLIAGVVYTWVYKRTGNLRAPIVSHAITNGTLGLWILATGQWRFW
jgi:CAAX prenyl protease-like protein